MRLLAAPDKFRGTIDATAAAARICRAAATCGWKARSLPLSDGGEGFGAILAGHLGGAPLSIETVGPLGEAIDASFFLAQDRSLAIIEMAEAAGRACLPRPTGNQPLDASTAGVGHLITAAVRSGVATVIVGCGGSATTDGGLGAIEVIESAGGLGGVELIVATDVKTHFVDAAREFGPQKGATSGQVALLEERLRQLVELYDLRFGAAIADLERSGAAGGLAGGLAALGGRLVSGFDLVAEAADLDTALEDADLVVTGEGHVDLSSIEGKVIGGLLQRAPAETEILIVAGSLDPEALDRARHQSNSIVTGLSMVETVGEDRAIAEPGRVLEDLTTQFLARR